SDGRRGARRPGRRSGRPGRRPGRRRGPGRAGPARSRAGRRAERRGRGPGPGGRSPGRGRIGSPGSHHRGPRRGGRRAGDRLRRRRLTPVRDETKRARPGLSRPQPFERMEASMAEITAALVKELREKSGVGMMDCKKALQETDGDINAALDWLRAKGLSKAAKKADRVAAEGLVAIATRADGAGETAAVIEFDAETDFVA